MIFVNNHWRIKKSMKFQRKDSVQKTAFFIGGPLCYWAKKKKKEWLLFLRRHFSDILFWKINLLFWLNLHCSLLQEIQLTICQPWFWVMAWHRAGAEPLPDPMMTRATENIMYAPSKLNEFTLVIGSERSPSTERCFPCLFLFPPYFIDFDLVHVYYHAFMGVH